jgi:ABC-type protease/lipase transport system fused ATPase/permease subunit
MRAAILGAALLFIGILASLTVAVVVLSGVSVLTLVSLLVLAVLAFGVIGALRNRSQE